MSLPMALFVLFGVLLIALLAWALRPRKRWTNQDQDVFELLSRPRHCTHLPQILRALQPEDIDFLRKDGKEVLMRAVRQQRRQIALHYLDQLQEEFEMLLEISRALAVMAPDAIAMQEMERWKLSAEFALNCTLLRIRIRLGLRPMIGFDLLSEMASGMARDLEATTTRIMEVAVRGAELPAPTGEESGNR